MLLSEFCTGVGEVCLNTSQEYNLLVDYKLFLVRDDIVLYLTVRIYSGIFLAFRTRITSLLLLFDHKHEYFNNNSKNFIKKKLKIFFYYFYIIFILFLYYIILYYFYIILYL